MAGASDAFDGALARLEFAIPKLLSCSVAKNLDKLRKRGVAHFNMSRPDAGLHRLFDVTSLGFRDDDLRVFLADVEPIVMWMAHFVGRRVFALHQFKRVQQFQAEDFWSRVMGKGAVEPPRTLVRELALLRGSLEGRAAGLATRRGCAR